MKIYFTIIATDRNIDLEFKPPKGQRAQAEGMNMSGGKLVVDVEKPGWEKSPDFKRVVTNAVDMVREAAAASEEEEEEE